MDKNKMVTITTLDHTGDNTRRVAVQTLEREKVLDMPYVTSVDGEIIKDWDDLLKKCDKSEDPQVLQTPIIVGG